MCVCGGSGVNGIEEGPAAGSAVVALDARTSVLMLTDTFFPNDFVGDAVSLMICVHGAWEKDPP